MEIKENGIKDTLKTALFRYRAVLSVPADVCGAYWEAALSLGMPMVCGLDRCNGRRNAHCFLIGGHATMKLNFSAPLAEKTSETKENLGYSMS